MLHFFENSDFKFTLTVPGDTVDLGLFNVFDCIKIPLKLLSFI
jgi:hypothetical protein